MSSLGQKLAKLAASAGVVAVIAFAFSVVGAIGASGASACVNVLPAVRNLQGEGSTLQRLPQEKWTGRKVPSTLGALPYTTVGGGYAASCSAATNATFSYTADGNAAALAAFGFTGLTPSKEFAYVGTDEAPTPAQISAATVGSGKVAPVILPVAATSIAVIVNKPPTCEIEGGITWQDLNSLFAGKVKHWTELSTLKGSAKANCTTAEGGSEITRVVREESTTVTTQFKHYLSVLETTLAATGPGKVELPTCSAKTWANLEPSGAANLAWPEAICDPGVTPVARRASDEAVAGYVKENPNSIGYTTYAAAFAKGDSVVALEDQFSKVFGASYAFPGKTPTGGSEPSQANCAPEAFEVPAAGQVATGNTGLEVDWSQTFGAKPKIGATGVYYPLCMLTYDIGWHGYKAAGYTDGPEVGAATHSYLSWILTNQSALNAIGFTALPNPSPMQNNVLGAAELSLTDIE
jgi:ABC-type phosphate transport system substrate-binding protein